MNPRKRQQLEQDMAEMGEILPQGWWTLYRGNLERGFEPAQALALVQAHIFGSAGNPIILSCPGPLSQKEDGET
jgi:hypothetical protein